MKKLPCGFKQYDKVTGRFGYHTDGAHPDWQAWQAYTVDHVQCDKKGNVALFVIGGVEFGPEQYEGTVDSKGTIHCLNVENIIFEFSF